MIFDKTLTFSDAQAVTNDAASTHVIDLGVDRDVGISDIDVYLKVMQEFDSATDTGTLNILLQTSDTENFASFVNLHQTGILQQTALRTSFELKFKLPQVTKRYVRFYYDNGSEVFTAGTITAALLTGRQNWRAYDAVTGV